MRTIVYESDLAPLPWKETQDYELTLPEGNKRIISIRFPASTLYCLNLQATWNYGISLKDSLIENKFPIELGEGPGVLSVYAENIGFVTGGKTLQVACQITIEYSEAFNDQAASILMANRTLVDPQGNPIKAVITIKPEDK